MPPTKVKPKTGLMSKIKDPDKKLDREPLWKGPEAAGPMGGVTQSMLSNFLVCRERFRLKYVEGWRGSEGFPHRLEYGHMWHTCEEAHAAGIEWRTALDKYCEGLHVKYSLHREQIYKWQSVCTMQYPVYVDYWSAHKDVQARTPLIQEGVFDIPYILPSGRTVRLRGKFDSVDLIGKGKDAGVYLQENKTKGDIDELQLRRQLTFDLQTMMYLTALQGLNIDVTKKPEAWGIYPIKGVRYNVVRRPLSGGKGNIKQKEGSKNVAPETEKEYYERLQQYFIKEPEHFFMRWKVEINTQEIVAFENRCLKPLLEQLCDWYEWVSKGKAFSSDDECENSVGKGVPSYVHFQFPFGTYNPLTEGGSTDFDTYISTGNVAGLVRRDKLFEELQ